MPKQSIEKFLGLSQEEIERRKGELVNNLPTLPGLAYLQLKLKKFEVEPWPFIIYLAHWSPDRLSDVFNRYRCYNGNESVQTMMEELKDYYIINNLIMIGNKEMNKRKMSVKSP
ncbi:MAG: hypothetical protein Q7R52_04290 [archaeon]|nr:hypothetical protein [archaeon]